MRAYAGHLGASILHLLSISPIGMGALVSMGKPTRGDSICQNKHKSSCSHIAHH